MDNLELNLDTINQDIESWIINFLEVKNPALGDFPPCPYARSARLKQSFEARIGNEVLDDLIAFGNEGMSDKEVVVFAYPPEQYQAKEFAALIERANQEILLSKDIIVLDDHPDDIEEVNGVVMNQGKYALAMIQCLSDLNEKAKLVAKKGFYDKWPEEYLQMIFKHREDPRI